ncbi:MAG: prolyl-tRNA synthetase associated domain-containing protein [Ruminococcaceae bacterium]|nr:prolyl-tRNA synthetase associated domain-containing protein [Oscillospiraceae bacterium]
MKLSEKASSVCTFLDEKGIKYDIVTHPSVFTLEECQAVNQLIGGRICKNLLLKTDSGKVFYLLMMRDDKRFVTKDVSKKLGCSRLSFASGEYMENLLNTSPGSLSITSLIFDGEKKISLAIDSDVLKEEYICCHPSDNSATLKIRTEDVMNVLIPALETEPKIIDI